MVEYVLRLDDAARILREVPHEEELREETAYSRRKWPMGVAEVAFLLSLVDLLNRHPRQCYSQNQHYRNYTTLTLTMFFNYRNI
jgi:hypothetical protein